MISKEHTNEDFFKIIGKISVVFATMDFFVTQILFRLMSAEDYNKLRINDSTTLGTKLEKLHTLKNENVDYPLVMIELRKILPKAIKIAKERNRYIHDLWEFNERKIIKGIIVRTRLKRRNDLNINVSDVTGEETLKIEDLNNFCNEIISIKESLYKISGAMPPFNRNNVKI